MYEKTFDCIKMKNDIQAERMKEYLANKEKYSSYADFINQRVQESAWVKQIRGKINKEKSN